MENQAQEHEQRLDQHQRAIGVNTNTVYNIMDALRDMKFTYREQAKRSEENHHKLLEVQHKQAEMKIHEPHPATVNENIRPHSIAGPSAGNDNDNKTKNRRW